MTKPKLRKEKTKLENKDYQATVKKTAADLDAVLKANKNNAKLLPEYLQTLLKGTDISIPKNTYPFTKPDWLDTEKLRRGQQFALENLFGLMFSTGISVIFGFTFKTIIQPLIYSGNSSSPFTAFKRYVLTISYVKTWYEGDFWQPGTETHEHMKSVRGFHEKIKKRLIETPPKEFEKKATNEGKPMWTDLHLELLEDFKSCPPLLTPISGPSHVHVNQTDMALTQFAFVGFILIFPKMFGIHHATREDLDSFAHVWRVIGYLLGIEDRFNVCSGDLETVQQRCHDIKDYWMKPLLRYVSPDWIHMSRCLTGGLALMAPTSAFEVSVMYLCKVIEVNTPRFAASVKFREKLIFNFTVFLYKYAVRIPGVRRLMNWLLSTKLKQSRNLPRNDLKKLSDKVYPYESNGKCPMMN